MTKTLIRKIFMYSVPTLFVVGLILFLVLQERLKNKDSFSEASIADIPVWFSPAASAQRTRSNNNNRAREFALAMGWGSSPIPVRFQEDITSIRPQLQALDAVLQSDDLKSDLLPLVRLLKPSSLPAYSHLPTPEFGPVFAAIGSRSRLFQHLVDQPKIIEFQKIVLTAWAFPDPVVSLDEFVTNLCTRISANTQELQTRWREICVHPVDMYLRLMMFIPSIDEFFVILSSAVDPANPLFTHYIDQGRFNSEYIQDTAPAISEYAELVNPHLYRMCTAARLERYCRDLDHKMTLSGVAVADIESLYIRIQNDRFPEIDASHSSLMISQRIPINVLTDQNLILRAIETAVVRQPKWPLFTRLANAQPTNNKAREIQFALSGKLDALINAVNEECKKTEHTGKGVCVDMEQDDLIMEMQLADLETANLADLVKSALEIDADECFMCASSYNQTDREKIATCSTGIHHCCRTCAPRIKQVVRFGFVTGRECPYCREVYQMRDSNNILI